MKQVDSHPRLMVLQALMLQQVDGLMAMSNQTYQALLVLLTDHSVGRGGAQGNLAQQIPGQGQKQELRDLTFTVLIGVS